MAHEPQTHAEPNARQLMLLEAAAHLSRAVTECTSINRIEMSREEYLDAINHAWGEMIRANDQYIHAAQQADQGDTPQ